MLNLGYIPYNYARKASYLYRSLYTGKVKKKSSNIAQVEDPTCNEKPGIYSRFSIYTEELIPIREFFQKKYPPVYTRSDHFPGKHTYIHHHRIELSLTRAQFIIRQKEEALTISHTGRPPQKKGQHVKSRARAAITTCISLIIA